MNAALSRVLAAAAVAVATNAVAAAAVDADAAAAAAVVQSSTDSKALTVGAAAAGKCSHCCTHSEAVPGHPVQLQFAPKMAAKSALGRRTVIPPAVPVDYLGLV